MNVIKVITALAIAPSAKADTVITPAKTAHTAHDTRRGRTVPRITANMYGTDATAEISALIITKTDIIKILSATNNALRYMPRLVIIFICNTTALKKAGRRYCYCRSASAELTKCYILREHTPIASARCNYFTINYITLLTFLLALNVQHVKIFIPLLHDVQ